MAVDKSNAKHLPVFQTCTLYAFSVCTTDDTGLQQGITVLQQSLLPQSSKIIKKHMNAETWFKIWSSKESDMTFQN